MFLIIRKYRYPLLRLWVSDFNNDAGLPVRLPATNKNLLNVRSVNASDTFECHWIILWIMSVIWYIGSIYRMYQHLPVFVGPSQSPIAGVANMKCEYTWICLTISVGYVCVCVCSACHFHCSVFILGFMFYRFVCAAFNWCCVQIRV